MWDIGNTNKDNGENAMILKRLNLCICFLIIIFPNTNWAYHSIVLSAEGQVYLVNSNEGYLLKYDPQNNKAIIFNNLDKINNCQSAAVAISRIDFADSKIAYSAFCSFVDTETPINMYPNGFHRLSIIDSRSKEKIASLDNIGLFDFSPDGNSIVLISDYPGSYEGGGGKPPAGFESGVWIYDFKSKKRSKVDTTSLNLKILDINWSEHDGNIYLMGWVDVYVKVLRYNVAKANIEVVPYKGIYFSPDGK